MSIVFLILLVGLLVIVFLVLAARFFPGSFLDVLDLDPETLAEQHADAAAEDLKQLRELEQRRRAGP